MPRLSAVGISGLQAGEDVNDGAAIYICGSLAGMASGVEAALVEIIGQDGLERLAAEERYRRDVY